MNDWAPATAIISALVCVVAFMQWRTAHQKVMLDLFDRRFAVFMDVREIVSRGGDRNHFDQGLPNEVVARGRFLFGEEVVSVLVEVYNLCTQRDIGTLKAGAIDDAFQRFILSATPYMKMDQKRVRTPAEWFRDRNKIRLSHGD